MDDAPAIELQADQKYQKNDPLTPVREEILNNQNQNVYQFYLIFFV